MVILSIISLLTTIVGLYLLGEKNKYGFVIFTVSLFCQMIIFINHENWFLVVQMIVLIIFNLFNFNKWRKEDK